MKSNVIAMQKKQQESVRRNATLISRILDELKRTNVKPENMTAIAKYVASRISDTQETNFSYTTIIRNSKYRSLVDKFMKEMGYEEFKENKALAKNLLATELKIDELESEVELLNKALQIQITKNAELLNTSKRLGGDASSKDVIDHKKLYASMLRIATKTYMDIDLDNNLIVDPQDDEVLINGDVLPGFFDWLREQGGNYG